MGDDGGESDFNPSPQKFHDICAGGVWNMRWMNEMEKCNLPLTDTFVSICGWYIQAFKEGLKLNIYKPNLMKTNILHSWWWNVLCYGRCCSALYCIIVKVSYTFLSSNLLFLSNRTKFIPSAEVVINSERWRLFFFFFLLLVLLSSLILDMVLNSL